MEQFKRFFTEDLLGRHIYSFLKTYCVVFLGILVAAEAAGTDVFQTAFLVTAAKSSVIAVLRNIYKLLTE